MSTALRPPARLLAAGALLLGLLGVSPPAAATEPTTIHVAPRHSGADDANQGSSGQPVRTISRGVALAQELNARGVPARVLVEPGLYREAVQFTPHAQRTDAPVVIEGAGDGVVVTGADPIGGWSALPGVPDGLQAPWPHRWGVQPLPDGWAQWWRETGATDLARRREVVTVNGRVLRQVASQADVASHPGSFHIDEPAGQIRLRLPAGVAVGDASVEAAVRPALLDIQGWRNVTIRRMAFRHANSSVQAAAVRVVEAHAVTLEDVRAEWNNWAGVAVQRSENVTLRRVAASHNGIIGITAWRVRHLLIEDTENSHNNWRGDWGNFRDWENGSKFMSVRDVTFRRFTAAGNRTHGLWLDYDVAGVVIEDSLLAGNHLYGLYVEALQGPVTMRGSTVCDNHRYGIRDGKADQVTVEDSRIFGNRAAQISFSGAPGGRWSTAFDTGQSTLVQSRGWTLRGNVIAGGAGQQLTSTTLPSADWDVVRSSLTSDRNTWHNASASTVFGVPGHVLDFPGWRQHTGGDVSSAFASPAEPLHCDDQAFAPADPQPSGEEATDTHVVRRPARIAGSDRYGTARHLFDELRRLPGIEGTVVLARGDDHGDALAGAPLAARHGAPILLTSGERLDAGTRQRLEDLRPERVVLLGSASAVSTGIEDELQTMPWVGEVVRLAGRNRYDTARLAAAEVGGTHAYVVEGTRGWPDAVSASALAALEQRPVLLVTPDTVPPETAAALDRLAATHVTVVGGRHAVGDAVVHQLRSLGLVVDRLAGRDRYETSLLVATRAEAAGAQPSRTWLATGRDWADALAAGPVVGADRGVLLLIDGRELGGSEPSASWLDRGGFEDLVVVGGRAAITDDVEREVRARATAGG